MNWYYVDAGQQAGPIDEAQLDALVRTGKVRPDTLVWREGMANWQPYGQVKAPGQASSPSATGVPPVMEKSSPEGFCSQCRRIFKVEEMIRHGSLYVCAECKPEFMQKLQEGASIYTGFALPENLRYAGFWIRFAAKFVDFLILMVVTMIPMFLAFGLGVSAPSSQGANPEIAMLVQLLSQLCYYILSALYAIFFIGKHAATPGKMLCGIKVVTIEGGRVSYARATGRFFAEILSYMICFIGYITAGFDPQKRSLHDHICSTFVIYK